MARIRTIKPEFFTSLTIADLTPEQRLTFIGLWTHVDDEGRCVDDARLIKAAVWPLDDRTAADIESDLRALTESSLITRYILNRKRYMVVTGWAEHQRINRPTLSKLPAPEQGELVPPEPPASGNGDSLKAHTHLSEDSPPERNREQGTGNREGSVEQEEASPPSSAISDRSDAERICAHLADRIEVNGSKRPAITKKWRDAARLMIDRDGRTEEQIHTCIDWCQNDDFWRSNILSVPKLREKYDQLRMAAQRKPPGRPSGPRRSTRDEAFLQHQALKAELFGPPNDGPPLNLIRGELA